MALCPPDPYAPDDIRGLSLCAGYGGLDLGLHIAEPTYRTVGYVEREAHAAATLVARMEDEALAPAPIWDDLRSFDGRPWRGRVDLVSAGYPCQPFSQAGHRRGAADPRHLWPSVARILEEVAPEWAFLENVAGHVSLGLGDVVRDLRGLGYHVRAGLFTAAEAGAPHLRRRLFILAHADGVGRGLFPRPHDRRGDALHGPVRHHGGKRRAVLPGERGPGVEPLVAGSGGTGSGPGEGDGDGVFVPGPDQFPQWAGLLARRPELEPALLRGDHGLADRLDRTRGAGNGVCSLAAAIAWTTLKSAFSGPLGPV